MQIDTTQITAEVYAENRDKHILYIKVTIPSLRIYINSCILRYLRAKLAAGNRPYNLLYIIGPNLLKERHFHDFLSRY